MGLGNEIGFNNALLWDLPKDMEHFRERTAQKTVVMGRKTFESIGKPLPKRRNIIVSRNTQLKIEGGKKFSDISQMLNELKKTEEEIFIIGGENIYRQFLPIATHLSLTIVNKKFPHADAFFPDWNNEQWKFSKISERKYKKDKNHEFDFVIEEWGKVV